MILYNVTVGIDPEIETDWLTWMKEVHIPKVMEAGNFYEHKIFKVLSHDDSGSISYSIQYFNSDLSQVVYYLENHAQSLSEEHRQRFLNRHVAFRTILEEVK